MHSVVFRYSLGARPFFRTAASISSMACRAALRTVSSPSSSSGRNCGKAGAALAFIIARTDAARPRAFGSPAANSSTTAGIASGPMPTRAMAACPASGACNATATITLAAPQTLFEHRGNQLDVRVSKLLRFGRSRVRANLDVFNLTNAGDVLILQNRYGPNWLQAINILPGRMVKVGLQLDF